VIAALLQMNHEFSSVQFSDTSWKPQAAATIDTSMTELELTGLIQERGAHIAAALIPKCNLLTKLSFGNQIVMTEEDVLAYLTL
jgi:hypothetical protein